MTDILKFKPMKTLSTSIHDKKVTVGQLAPGDIFILNGYLWVYVNKSLQIMSASGEKAKLDLSTEINVISYEISIDGVREWIRKEWPRTKDSRKEISVLEKLALLNEAA